MIGRRPTLAAMAALLAMAPAVARAEWLRDEIVVYADTALRPTLAALATAFRAGSGIRVRTFCAPSKQMLALLAHGTQDDILITQIGPMNDAAAARLVTGAAKKLWRNRLVLAATGTGPAATDFDAARLRAALAGGKLAAPDPSDASPIDGPALLQHLGVTGANLLGAADTEDAAATLKRGEATAALCHTSQIAADPALRVLMRIPDDAYAPIFYGAALSARAWSRYQDRFLAYLAGDAAGLMPNLGLEFLA